MKIGEMLEQIRLADPNAYNEIQKMNDKAKRKTVCSWMNEEGIARLRAKYGDCDYGMITAARGDLSHNENQTRNKELKSVLLVDGFSVTEIKGTHIENYGTPNAVEVHETLFLVFDYRKKGNLSDKFRLYGRCYDQDSVVFWTPGNGVELYLFGANSSVRPGSDQTIGLGKSMFAEDGSFLSKINGCPFVFESTVHGCLGFDNKETDYSINAIRVMHGTAGSIREN